MGKIKNIFDIKKYCDLIKFKFSNVLKVINKYDNTKKIESINNNKDFNLVISLLTAQSKSCMYEKRICSILQGEKINSREDKGDCIDKDGKIVEIKCSTPSMYGNVLNIVQIRLHQTVDYYICAFIDEINYENNFVFRLTKEQMRQECDLIGSSAHGASKKQQINKEMRISIKLDDMDSDTTKLWLSKYRDKDLERKLFK